MGGQTNNEINNRNSVPLSGLKTPGFQSKQFDFAIDNVDQQSSNNGLDQLTSSSDDSEMHADIKDDDVSSIASLDDYRNRPTRARRSGMRVTAWEHGNKANQDMP